MTSGKLSTYLCALAIPWLVAAIRKIDVELKYLDGDDVENVVPNLDWDDEGGFFDCSGFPDLQVFAVEHAGEKWVAGCGVEGDSTKARLGWKVMGKEVRVQPSNDMSKSEHYFVWKPDQCVLRSDNGFEPFTQSESRCEGKLSDAPQSWTGLKKGLADKSWFFGIEFEAIAKFPALEKQENEKDGKYKNRRKAHMHQCLRNMSVSLGSDMKDIMDTWNIIDDGTVQTIATMKKATWVDDRIADAYISKLPDSELDGIPFECTSPIMKGDEGVDNMVGFLTSQREMGIQTNLGTDMHMHINTINKEVGGTTLSLKQYVAVLLSWVENQVAINSMQACVKMAAPYSVILYADQSPVSDWFPGMFERRAEIEAHSESGKDPTHILRELLNPNVKALNDAFVSLGLVDDIYEDAPEVNIPGSDKQEQIEYKANLSREVIDPWLKDVVRGWRGKKGSMMGVPWRPTFNYDATVGKGPGLFINKWGQKIDWKDSHGSVEIRQHLGTTSPEDAARWVQFLIGFMHYYSQSDQVDRVWASYLSGADVTASHEKLILNQQKRSLNSLLEDLSDFIDEDSPDYFRNHACSCEAKTDGQGSYGVKYDPTDGKLFSYLQTAEEASKSEVAHPK